ncbi:FtsX-like permease family protein [Cryobacterium levicorallinum]|uniref:ABC transport system permease protein n=1 Tax=Cryobacterium levicorallinum TaxID=995038 RepID=A0A1I2YSD6_9MICO|nr:ABC transporter permease [Cryobacterium levicorallinum]TFB86097.1 FtsX-like permease family protein [Cryobacterium levicorallinum]GEP27636.1 multidrug ABC transporter substrate-binding protein [Cryobacterium levicorallinum]SFH27551.1 putative ABC transport system permease protein [Cryobacterium levicorallinum]
MSWLESFRTSWSAVYSHALRSILTVLGILIGIAAVILTVGLGLGTQKDVSAQISSLGSNLLIIAPGSSTDTAGLRGGFGSTSTLTIADAQALTSSVNAPDISAVAAEKTLSLSLEANDTNWTTSVTGTTTSWLDVRARTLSMGAFISDDDEETSAAVVVLGPETADELFGTQRVVGQSVVISDKTFQVIGVLDSAGSDSSGNLDDMAIVPFSTAASALVGGTESSAVSTIYLQAASDTQLSAAYQEAETLLLNLHSITDSTAADFTISSQDALVSTATAVYETLTILLTGVAALSLLVGGIGVMNIMLVSVSERTREIGLRKALGAPPGAIRRQFLIEAAILGLSGGLLGAILGVTAALLLPGVIGSSIVVSPAAVGLSIGVAIVIGLSFGVYPAARAARLAPIDALRSE